MHRITVETPCRPTESVAKVRLALLNLFPDTDLEEDDVITGTATSLERLAELFRNQRVRTSAREVLSGAVRGDRLVFHLNKQAAVSGKVSFSAESPLGDIRVTVVTDNPAEVVDELAPRRSGG